MTREQDRWHPERSLFNAPFFEDRFADFEPLSASGLSVFEDKQNICVEADMPGLKPEDVEITFEKGVLWIRGERKQETKDEGKKYYRKSSRAFSYQVQVPGAIDEKSEPEATYKDGVMHISFHKAENQKAKKINIKTK